MRMHKAAGEPGSEQGEAVTQEQQQVWLITNQSSGSNGKDRPIVQERIRRGARWQASVTVEPAQLPVQAVGLVECQPQQHGGFTTDGVTQQQLHHRP